MLLQRHLQPFLRLLQCVTEGHIFTSLPPYICRVSLPAIPLCPRALGLNAREKAFAVLRQSQICTRPQTKQPHVLLLGQPLQGAHHPLVQGTIVAAGAQEYALGMKLAAAAGAAGLPESLHGELSTAFWLASAACHALGGEGDAKLIEMVQARLRGQQSHDRADNLSVHLTLETLRLHAEARGGDASDNTTTALQKHAGRLVLWAAEDATRSSSGAADATEQREAETEEPPLKQPKQDCSPWRGPSAAAQLQYVASSLALLLAKRGRMQAALLAIKKYCLPLLPEDGPTNYLYALLLAHGEQVFCSAAWGSRRNFFYCCGQWFCRSPFSPREHLHAAAGETSQAQATLDWYEQSCGGLAEGMAQLRKLL